jgi:hypothetical protein
MIDWEMERVTHRLSHEELVQQLEFEYYAILAANPDWEASLEEFLRERGVEQ